MEYIIRTSIFSTGERFPVLLHSKTYQPVSLTTRYVIDERRETKQSSTIERDLRILRWLYIWADNQSIDLESKLRQGEILTLNQVTSFCRFLRVRGNTNLVGSINYISNESTTVLSPQIFNIYIQVVKDFLTWAVTEFIPLNAATDKVREIVAESKKRIETFFKNKKLKGKNPQVKGLEDKEVLALCEVIKPECTNNPFKKSCQFRN